jgi:hypothetical protein
MKKFFVPVALVVSLAACQSGPDTTENAADSLDKRKDTLIEKVDSTADAKIDSIKERSKDLKQNFDSSIEAKKDSLKGNK